jgi:hypothetical protein
VDEDDDRKAASGPPVKRRARAKALAALFALVAAPLLVAQVAGTLGQHSGNDYAAAYVRGDATVVSCERRGPVSVLYFGYWDECTAEVRMNSLYARRMTFDKPNLFHAGDVGKTVRIGKMRDSRNSHNQYAREDFPPDPVLRFLAWTLGLIDVIPLCLLGWVLWTTLKELLKWPFRKLSRRSVPPARQPGPPPGSPSP